MSKLILINSIKERQSSIISNFHNDLGSLMRLRGFQLRKRFDGLGHLISLDWFSFARNRVLFEVQFNRPDLTISEQISPYLEQIISELSIFQLVDLFLFDELGILEPLIEPIRQQIITIFASRIPVIAIVNQKHLQKIDYLSNLGSIEYQSIRGENSERIYLNLIGALYDY